MALWGDAMIADGEGRKRTKVDHLAVIVAAYVSNHRITPGEMPALIATVQSSLTELSNNHPVNVIDTAKATQAEIRRSITPYAIVSFIDGKPYKSLKRHLRAHGMTGSTYRLRYGLPPDYPMVTSSYSARRSAISESIISNLRKNGRPVGRDNNM
jgi:predicted transcriptional regulator